MHVSFLGSNVGYGLKAMAWGQFMTSPRGSPARINSPQQKEAGGPAAFTEAEDRVGHQTRIWEDTTTIKG